MANEQTGKSAYIKYGSTVLSTDFRTLSTSEENGLVDATAGADTYKVWLATHIDGGASLNLVDTGGSAIWQALLPGTSGTLEWGPEGTASTKPKFTVTAVVTSRKRDIPYADVVVISADVKFSGAITEAAY